MSSKRRVSGSLEDLIEQRKSYVCKSKEDKHLMPIEGVDRYAIACSPILAQGDVKLPDYRLALASCTYCNISFKLCQVYFTKNQKNFAHRISGNISAAENSNQDKVIKWRKI